MFCKTSCLLLLLAALGCALAAPGLEREFKEFKVRKNVKSFLVTK
jgi:hypothetical protein